MFQHRNFLAYSSDEEEVAQNRQISEDLSHLKDKIVMPVTTEKVREKDRGS